MFNSKIILDFWFKECDPKMWFKKDIEFDKLIKNKFQKTLKYCLDNEINENPLTKENYLSWIIVLDQFSRNIYRNQIRSFAGDEIALKLSKIAIKKSFLKSSENNYNSFFLMPFMHSEKLSDHEFSLPFFKKYTNKKTYDSAQRHKKVIETFSRYPHRNEILGRKSTKSELEFLKLPGSKF
jgi:uncharacterized protein (DUF924 family)